MSEKIGDFPLGPDRRHPDEPENQFNASYGDLMSKLVEKHLPKLMDVVTRIPEDAKAILAQALNRNGYDWRFLSTFAKDTEEQAASFITEWQAGVTEAKDKNSADKTTQELIDTLYGL